MWVKESGQGLSMWLLPINVKVSSIIWEPHRCASASLIPPIVLLCVPCIILQNQRAMIVYLIFSSSPGWKILEIKGLPYLMLNPLGFAHNIPSISEQTQPEWSLTLSAEEGTGFGRRRSDSGECGKRVALQSQACRWERDLRRVPSLDSLCVTFSTLHPLITSTQESRKHLSKAASN